MSVDIPLEVLRHVGEVLLLDTASLLCQTLFFGIHAVLICISTYLLLEKYKKDKSRANTMMLVATLTLFAASTASSAIDVAGTIITLHSLFFRKLDVSLEDKFPAINLSQNILSAIGTSFSNVIFSISDAIVVWRACVLWQDHKKVIAVHVVLLSCAIALNLVYIGLLLTNVEMQSDYLLDIIDYLQQVSWPLALVTNMVATSFITYKAWLYRQSIRQNTVSHRRTAVEKIMIVFIESGILYCVIWIALIASERLGVANGQPATHMSTPTMMQLAGIYPTLIIIFVALQKTVSDMSGHSGHGISSMSAFAAAPANRIASMVASHLDTNGVEDVHVRVHSSVSLESRSSASMGAQEGTRGGKSKEMVVNVEEDMALSV